MLVIIGKSGQLARELARFSENRDMVFLGREQIDISSFETMSEVLDNLAPDAIINASAYTAVDKAESDQEGAYRLNHLGVKHLAEYVKGNDIHLVHVSTDYVFGGQSGVPYQVDEPHAPIGVYGASKAAGEREIMALIPQNGCIIRTSWVYSCHGANFVKTMLRLMKEKPQLGVIDDQIGSPTSAKALARACLYAAENNVAGIHHFTDAGVASWFDFAVAIQTLAIQKGMLVESIPVNPIPTSAYPTPAKRPHYSVLDKRTLASSFDGLQPKHWQTELGEVLDELKALG